MRVRPVPCLRDNYAYLVWRAGAKEALVVDPSEAEPVLEALRVEGLTLVGILNTHHHYDHVGGNAALVERCGPLPVFAHASDAGRIPAQTVELEQGSVVALAGLVFDVLHVPGHTLGAVAYAGEGAVFTGDTLFAAGCGRLFEGTAVMMYESLNSKLGALPDATRVYPGHEYTESNLRFAAHVEPANREVVAKLERVRAQRSRAEPTIPSTIGEERLTNPFLRVTSPELLAAVAGKLGGERTPAAAFGALRAMKDTF